MITRRGFLAISTALVAAPLVTEAQPGGKVWRIGLLGGIPESGRWTPLFEALRKLGYVEGQNLAIGMRSARGKAEPFPEFAAELVRLKVDVIVAGDNPAIAAAQKATRTIPIVMVLAQDPVANGFAHSLARPGGNLTGLTVQSTDLQGKTLQILKEAIPTAKALGLTIPSPLLLQGGPSDRMTKTPKNGSLIRGRLATLVLNFLAFVSLLAAEAQEPKKIPLVGFLGQTSATAQAPVVEALLAGLRDLGYVQGKNIAIEFRWAEGKYERLPTLAAELVRLKVDVLVTGGTAGVRAAMQTSATTPIVMISSGDAVAAGLVTSLARPGGNVTGSTLFVPEFMTKRLDLLKEAMPRTRRVAALVNPDDPSRVPVIDAMELAAARLRIELRQFQARQPGELERVFSTMAKGRVDAVVVQEDAFLTAHAAAIADLATKNRLLAVGSTRFADSGGCIGYSANGPALVRRAAYFVDRILKGAKPSDLPIERPTKFDLVINRKTANALGLTIPPSLLLRADRVLE